MFAAASVLVATACSAQASSPAASPPVPGSTVSSSATGPAVVTCPDGGGGLCVGQLAAGRHRSQALHPALT